jgi:hypothetical protein
MCDLRRKIRLYAEAPISLSLLFGLFEDELLDVAVNLVLLYAAGSRLAHLGTHETGYDRR